jgi:hypothetical protein
MRLLNRLGYSVDPQRTLLRSIEWVIAVFTLVGGLFIFTPVYTIETAAYPGVFAQALTSPFSIYMFAIILVIGAILAIIGKITHKPQIKSVGWFSIFLARFFQILTTLLVQGFLPVTWLYPLTIMFVVIILWIRARFEVYQTHAS